MSLLLKTEYILLESQGYHPLTWSLLVAKLKKSLTRILFCFVLFLVSYLYLKLKGIQKVTTIYYFEIFWN